MLIEILSEFIKQVNEQSHQDLSESNAEEQDILGGNVPMTGDVNVLFPSENLDN